MNNNNNDDNSDNDIIIISDSKNYNNNTSNNNNITSNNNNNNITSNNNSAYNNSFDDFNNNAMNNNNNNNSFNSSFNNNFNNFNSNMNNSSSNNNNNNNITNNDNFMMNNNTNYINAEYMNSNNTNNANIKRGYNKKDAKENTSLPYHYGTTETNNKLYPKNLDYIPGKQNTVIVPKRLVSTEEWNYLMYPDGENSEIQSTLNNENNIVHYKRTRADNGYKIGENSLPDETYLFIEYLWRKFCDISQRLLLCTAVRLELQKSMDSLNFVDSPYKRQLIKQVKEEIKYLEFLKNSLFSVIETFEKDSTTDGTNFSKKMRSSKT